MSIDKVGTHGKHDSCIGRLAQLELGISIKKLVAVLYITINIKWEMLEEVEYGIVTCTFEFNM